MYRGKMSGLRTLQLCLQTGAVRKKTVVQQESILGNLEDKIQLLFCLFWLAVCMKGKGEPHIVWMTLSGWYYATVVNSYQ